LKKSIYFSFLLFCWCGNVFGAEEKVITLAVSNFEILSGGTENKWIGESFVDAISSKLSSKKNLKIIERKFLSKIIEEQKFQASGLVDENSAVEIGNLLAAQYFVMGTITLDGGNMAIRSKVVDIATSQIVSNQEIIGNNNEIFKLQDLIIQKIADSFSLGTIENVNGDASKQENINFAVATKLEKIKKMADLLPFFALDPARKRKATEYLLASNMCDDLIEKYPNLYKAHYYKCLFSLQSEDFVSSDSESLLAKNLNPNEAESFLARASHFFLSKKYAESKQVLEFCAQKFPNDARVWFALSKLNYEENNLVAQMENLIIAIGNSPYIAMAESNLKFTITSLNFSESSFSKPEYFYLAQIYKTYYSSNENINSDTYLFAQKISEISPNFCFPYLIMGLYENAKNESKKAQGHLLNAIKIRPEFLEAHKEVGLSFINTGYCNLGKKHLSVYLNAETAISNIGELKSKLNNCK